MNAPPAISPETGAPDGMGASRRRNRFWARLWTDSRLALGGLAAPVLCWLYSLGNHEYRPNWKTEEPEGLLLCGEVVWPLFPFLLYSMASLFLLILDRGHARRFLVRLGIYSGILPSLVFIAVQERCGIAAFRTLIYVLGVWVILLLLERVIRRTWVIGPIFLLALFCFSLVAVGPPIFLLWLLLLIAGPAASLVAYGEAALYVWNRGTAPFLRAAGSWLGLGGLCGGTWYFILGRAADAFERLPATQPPGEGCYIATAAARGHPRIVGSWPCLYPDGRIRRVNRQLLVLKAGEIALRARRPRLHRRLRRIYDAVGPRLAAALGPPLLADLAYLLLKPLEWGTRLVLGREAGTNGGRDEGPR